MVYSFRNLVAAGVALATFEALSGSVAQAWGPATHIQLAYEMLSHVALLPSAIAGLLSRYAVDFIFGNIAADVVFAKKKSRKKQICHQWKTGFQLLDEARSDPSRAFAYGYLAHLAADTVAHNKYIPRQVVLNGTTQNFGHLYWELRAELMVESRYWSELRSFVGRRFVEHEAHMARQLPGTLLSFENNLRVFHGLNRLVSRKTFRVGMTAWDRLSRFDLCGRMVADYRHEAVDRIHSVLCHGQSSAVVQEDPNGNEALRRSRRHKREYQLSALLGLPLSERVIGLVEQQAPNPRPRPLLPASHASEAMQPPSTDRPGSKRNRSEADFTRARGSCQPVATAGILSRH